MTRTYTVSQDKDSGLWYAHMRGFSYIPVMITGRNTFSESKRYAQANAAMCMGLPLKEYLKLKEGEKNGRRSRTV